MGDKEARALGAGEIVSVEGREYRISPLNARQLQEVQRAALKNYKQQCLQVYLDNRDALPEGVLERKLEEVSKWDIDSLPSKISYDCDNVPVNGAVSELLNSVYNGMNLDFSVTTEIEKRALLARALNKGDLTADKVEQTTGQRPGISHTPYDFWWISTSYDAMALFVAYAIIPNHPEVTKSQISNWPITELAKIATTVKEITEPALGNT